VSLYILHALSLVVMDDVDCIVITPCDRAREIVLALVTSPMCFNICYLERTFNHFYYVCCFGFANLNLQVVVVVVSVCPFDFGLLRLF